MAKVGDKTFEYSDKGLAEAAAESIKTNEPVELAPGASEQGYPSADARDRATNVAGDFTYERGGSINRFSQNVSTGESIYERNQRIREERLEKRKAKAEARKKDKPKEEKVVSPEKKVEAKKEKPKVKTVKDTSREEKRNIKKIEKLKEKGVKVTTTAENLEDTKKLKPTGKIKKKDVKEVLVTEGGAYPTYKKESKPAKSFRDAFAEARKAGKDTFEWHGRKYTTDRADDKKKEAKDKPKVEPKKVAKEVKPKPMTLKGETSKEKARLDKEYKEGKSSETQQGLPRHLSDKTVKTEDKIKEDLLKQMVAEEKAKDKPTKKKNIISPIVKSIKASGKTKTKKAKAPKQTNVLGAGGYQAEYEKQKKKK